MSISKKFLKNKPVCKVTFKLPKKVIGAANEVALVGDFNAWNTGAELMKSLKSGDFTTTVELEKGKEYQFRYLIDGAKWENDGDADKFVPTPYQDAENSVVIV